MTRLLAFAVVLLSLGKAAPAQTPEQYATFLAPAYDRALIQSAIEAAHTDLDYPTGVTGLVVPHHLVAADLIARGFWAASQGTYERIILIGPDHFNLLASGFASTNQDLDTIFGTMLIDQTGFDTLQGAGVTQMPVFSDHSLTAITPFIAHFFAEVPVVPILAALNTTPQDWADMAEILQGLVTDKTLVIQSTDFSHFLSWGESATHDQATLAVLTSNDVEGVHRLHQPHHLDSQAATVIQMLLQRKIGAQPTILANRNSAQYGGARRETTSYIVAAYHQDPAAIASLRWQDQRLVYFGGDVFAGRFLRPFLDDPALAHAISAFVANVVNGAPFVANLEGALWDSHIEHLPNRAHLMERDLAVPILRHLGLTHVGLANNHSFDLAADGFARTKDILADADVSALEHGMRHRVGPVDVMALNFVPPNTIGGALAAPTNTISDLCSGPGGAPLVLYLHWGDEFEDKLSARQKNILTRVQSCAPAAVFAAHNHRASTTLKIYADHTPLVPSLGNLLFDQPDVMGASGALVELRVFDQGTHAARIIPIPNLYQQMLDQGVSQ